MKPTKPKPSRAVFLLAAEIQLANMQGADSNDTSHYACDNIGHARIKMGMGHHFCGTIDHEFFADRFKPEKREGGWFGWWEDLPYGRHDHESRILALLLCAEMLRR